MLQHSGPQSILCVHERAVAAGPDSPSPGVHAVYRNLLAYLIVRLRSQDEEIAVCFCEVL
jgi:hypothetical protein